MANNLSIPSIPDMRLHATGIPTSSTGNTQKSEVEATFNLMAHFSHFPSEFLSPLLSFTVSSVLFAATLSLLSLRWSQIRCSLFHRPLGVCEVDSQNILASNSSVPSNIHVNSVERCTFHQNSMTHLQNFPKVPRELGFTFSSPFVLKNEAFPTLVLSQCLPKMMESTTIPAISNRANSPSFLPSSSMIASPHLSSPSNIFSPFFSHLIFGGTDILSLVSQPLSSSTVFPTEAATTSHLPSASVLFFSYILDQLELTTKLHQTNILSSKYDNESPIISSPVLKLLKCSDGDLTTYQRALITGFPLASVVSLKNETEQEISLSISIPTPPISSYGILVQPGDRDIPKAVMGTSIKRSQAEDFSPHQDHSHLYSEGMTPSIDANTTYSTRSILQYNFHRRLIWLQWALDAFGITHTHVLGDNVRKNAKNQTKSRLSTQFRCCDKECFAYRVICLTSLTCSVAGGVCVFLSSVAKISIPTGIIPETPQSAPFLYLFGRFLFFFSLFLSLSTLFRSGSSIHAFIIMSYRRAGQPFSSTFYNMQMHLDPAKTKRTSEIGATNTSLPFVSSPSLSSHVSYLSKLSYFVPLERLGDYPSRIPRSLYGIYLGTSVLICMTAGLGVFSSLYSYFCPSALSTTSSLFSRAIRYFFRILVVVGVGKDELAASYFLMFGTRTFEALVLIMTFIATFLGPERIAILHAKKEIGDSVGTAILQSVIKTFKLSPRMYKNAFMLPQNENQTDFRLPSRSVHPVESAAALTSSIHFRHHSNMWKEDELADIDEYEEYSVPVLDSQLCLFPLPPTSKAIHRGAMSKTVLRGMERSNGTHSTTNFSSVHACELVETYFASGNPLAEQVIMKEGPNVERGNTISANLPSDSPPNAFTKSPLGIISPLQSPILSHTPKKPNVSLHTKLYNLQSRRMSYNSNQSSLGIGSSELIITDSPRLGSITNATVGDDIDALSNSGLRSIRREFESSGGIYSQNAPSLADERFHSRYDSRFDSRTDTLQFDSKLDSKDDFKLDSMASSLDSTSEAVFGSLSSSQSLSASSGQTTPLVGSISASNRGEVNPISASTTLSSRALNNNMRGSAATPMPMPSSTLGNTRSLDIQGTSIERVHLQENTAFDMEMQDNLLSDLDFEMGRSVYSYSQTPSSLSVYTNRESEMAGSNPNSFGTSVPSSTSQLTDVISRNFDDHTSYGYQGYGRSNGHTIRKEITQENIERGGLARSLQTGSRIPFSSSGNVVSSRNSMVSSPHRSSMSSSTSTDVSSTSLALTHRVLPSYPQNQEYITQRYVEEYELAPRSSAGSNYDGEYDEDRGSDRQFDDTLGSFSSSFLPGNSLSSAVGSYLSQVAQTMIGMSDSTPEDSGSVSYIENRCLTTSNNTPNSNQRNDSRQTASRETMTNSDIFEDGTSTPIRKTQTSDKIIITQRPHYGNNDSYDDLDLEQNDDDFELEDFKDS